MNIKDIFSAEAVALHISASGSNKIPYLGTGFFPSKKKMGLDLKWIKGHKGVPISLAPSSFDTKSRLRDRIGMSINKAEMAFFKESILVSEEDEQNILRVTEANDPYALEVVSHIFDDVSELVSGADVVAERMRMQLLAPLGGNVGISISANGSNYFYDYDPDGSWKSEHYLKIETATDKWNDAANCDPMADLEAAIDAQEMNGSRPEIVLMDKTTFNYMKNSAKVRSGVLAQNTTANVNYTTGKVKAYIEEELKVTVVVYNKKYKDESGVTSNFYPSNIVMLMPNTFVGSTWYGTTPEERSAMGDGKDSVDVAVVNTGVAVKVTRTTDPENTKTTVSEIVLPSFEGMDECYALEVV